VALGEGLCPKWSIVATSGFTVAAATLLPKVFGRLDQAGNLVSDRGWWSQGYRVEENIK